MLKYSKFVHISSVGRRAILSGAFVLFALGLGGCGEKVGPWRTEELAPSGTWPNLALDAAGRPHVAFASVDAKHLVHINYAVRSENGWKSREILDLGNNQYEELVFRITTDGPCVLLYGRDTGIPVKACEKNDWRPVNLIPTKDACDRTNTRDYGQDRKTPAFCTSAQIDLGPDGTPYIFYPIGGTLRLGRWKPDFQSELVSKESGLGYGVLSVDSSGTPLVSFKADQNYKDSVLSYVTLGNLVYSSPDAPWAPWRWTSYTLEHGEYTGLPLLARDNNGRTHMLYADALGETVTYAHTEGGTWIKRNVAKNADIFSKGFYSLAIDGSGRAHIAYSSEYLHYVRFEGKSRLSEKISATEAMLTSIGVDQNGTPHVVYRNRHDSRLMYGVRE